MSVLEEAKLDPSKAGTPKLCPDRVRVDGKFFRLGASKFQVKGVAYGPFRPNAQGEMFASPEQTALDFKLIAQLGANVLRLYRVPPRWFLDLAAGHHPMVLS